MADTTQKSVEEQAQVVVEMAKNGQKIEKPLSTEVEVAARKIVEGLDADNKVKVRAALDALKENVPDTTKLIGLKRTMEQEVTSVTTVDQAKKILDKLDGLDADSRKIVISYLWSKLTLSGYTLTTQNNKVNLTHSTDAAGATALEATLASYVDAKKLNFSEIQRVVVMGSGSFGNFLDTQSINLKGVSVEKYLDFISKTYKLDLSKGDIPKKVQLINSSSATIEEKAFLISYVNGGFNNYNLAPDAERVYQLRKDSKDLMASPGFAQVQSVVNTASGGAVAQEKLKMQQATTASSKPQELTVESFMNNPASAISKYPWTSLALVIGGIWKFGFMKTIGGLLFGAIGIKAINEIGGETEIGRQLKDGLKKGVNSATEAVSGAAGAASEAVVSTVNNVTESKESTFQKKASDLVRSDDRIKGNVNKHLNSSASSQKATIEDYLKYINTDLSGKSLQVLLTPQNSEHSILSPKSSLDPSITIPANFDSQILKDILRKYFTGTSISVTKLSDSANQEAVKNAIAKSKGATTLLGAIEKIHA